LWHSLAVRISLALAIISLGGSLARAQGIFCPSSAGIQTGISLQGGTCTNNTTGAFSGAAFASQALSDLAQSTTHESTNTAFDGISVRRASEEAACEAGFVLVNGVCQASASAWPGRPVTPVPIEKRSSNRLPLALAPILKEQLRSPPDRYGDHLPSFGYRIGAWAHGYGDYERRTGTSASPVDEVFIIARSTTNSGGFMGGVDLTARSLLSGRDGLILGLVGGYVSSDVKVRTSVLSTDPTNLNNGFANVKVSLSGPSAGIYASYFSGPFSNDLLLKNDFLDLGEAANQLLAYNGNPGLRPQTFPYFGAGRTNLDQFTASDNVNYKFIQLSNMWFEPTVGIQYTRSSYGGSAALLGLKDGYRVRLQGGARLGFDTFLGQTRLTTTLTSLVYDDVVVNGDFIQGGAFTTATNALKDQGKVRADEILAVNIDCGNGVSTFVQGEVRGGRGLFGAGGKAGLRVQW
jgi:hypothetical protein